MTSSEYLIWGIVIHLVCDWLLQNAWMAGNKTNLRHPAGYVHGAINAAGMILLFPLWAAVFIGFTHWLIDLRFIMVKHRELMNQPTDGPYAIPVALWADQVVHIVVIAGCALLITA
jgi:hypothetical protein